MKIYHLDMKKFLTQCNWKHEDFGKIAAFFGQGKWEVSEDMLTEITNERL